MNNSRRVLGIFDATSMVTGNMIGSGIFLLVGYAAEPVSSGTSLVFAWIAGGLMALMGAFCIAELSTRFPQTGGDFIYLHSVWIFSIFFIWMDELSNFSNRHYSSAGFIFGKIHPSIHSNFRIFRRCRSSFNFTYYINHHSLFEGSNWFPLPIDLNHSEGLRNFFNDWSFIVFTTSNTQRDNLK